jgi:ppGpp synthetase/RelA/SpoT-type nucleotidyltranferase
MSPWSRKKRSTGDDEGVPDTKAAMSGNADGERSPTLTYEDYIVWYSRASQRYLEPARSSAERMLKEFLDLNIDPVDRGRFRVSTSRVKSAQRSFAKLSGDKYRPRFTDYDHVPNLIDDLVGLRLICNNLSDINTFQEVVGELPIDDGSQVALSVELDSQRDYFADPKPSGYRAFHVNFVVPVAQAQGTKRVRVEVQVRTLLQDGWGELTHEDTYKPGSTVPDWIVRMSLRMADLLAAVDNIAQDLRTGLDVESQKAIEVEAAPAEVAQVDIVDGSTSVSAEHPPLGLGQDQLRAALIREARSIVDSIERPTGLASISQTLTARFGTDITQVWSRSGGFKLFLQSQIEGITITGPMPGYVHPHNAELADWPPLGEAVERVPDVLRELRTHEKALPLIPSDRMAQAIESVASVLQAADYTPTDSGRVSSTQLASLARLARADGEQNGHLVVRPHAHYILWTLNRAGSIAPTITAADIRLVLLNAILGHLDRSGLLKKNNTAGDDISRWLAGRL